MPVGFGEDAQARAGFGGDAAAQVGVQARPAAAGRGRGGGRCLAGLVQGCFAGLVESALEHVVESAQPDLVAGAQRAASKLQPRLSSATNANLGTLSSRERPKPATVR